MQAGRPMQDPTTHPDADVGRVEVREAARYRCACRRGVRLHPRGGVVRDLGGNADHPPNHGLIGAKGAAEIVRQCSAARLGRSRWRKPGAERGTSQFAGPSRAGARGLLTQRPRKPRAEDPERFLPVTGRAPMSALTGLFAKQFGTANAAADAPLGLTVPDRFVTCAMEIP